MKTFFYSFMLWVWMLSLMPTQAEVVLDGSLGTSGALPGPDYLIQPEFGQQRGANLFHSFSDFNLSSTESATFTGPATINNVISRITGGSPSSINGLVRSSIESADLYLINPNGLIFGDSASFDVNGSVHLSSAEQLKFADGTAFDTTFTAEPILTAAAPSAFGFLSPTPAEINFNGSRFGVADGETLSIVGGDIQVTGTQIADQLTPALLVANSGQLRVASLGSAGEVAITSEALEVTGTSGNLALDKAWLYAQNGGDIFIQAGRLTLENLSRLNIDSTADVAGGQMHINVNQLAMQSSSTITSSTFASAQGGDININVIDSVSVSGANRLTSSTSFIAANANSQETDAGSAGRIMIKAASVELAEGGLLGARSAGPGDAGEIYIEANHVNIAGEAVGASTNSSIASSITTNATRSGNGGSIEIIADSLVVSDGGTIFSQVDVPFSEPDQERATGQGGNITLRIGGLLHVDGQGALSGGASSISSLTDSLGDGGSLIIRAGELLVQGGAEIVAVSTRTGNGGEIDIEVVGDAIIEGESGLLAAPSSISSATSGNGLDFQQISEGLGGNAGNIRLKAQNIVLRNGGSIFADTFVGRPADASQGVAGNGRAGQITVEADTITISGEPTQAGQNVAGIYAGTFLRVEGNERIQTAGDGGTIDILAKELTLQNGAEIGTQSATPGRGGNINIQADNLKLTQNSVLTTESSGTGNAGDLMIQTDGGFELNQGFIRTAAAVADGGNITIVAPHYIYLENSEITTSVQSGVGQGGNINLEPEFIIQKNSPILARAFGGPGGNINILTRSIYVFPPFDSSPIDASSALSEDGIITIQSPDGTLEEDVVILVSDFIDASTLLQSLCSVEAAQDATSSFVVTQREGAPNNQSDLLPSNPLLNQLPGLELSENQPAAQPLQVAQRSNPLFMGLVVASAGEHAEPRKGLWFGCSRASTKSRES